MRNGIASAFWKWRRTRSPGQAQAPAWMTSPNKPVLEQELCSPLPTRDALLEAVYQTEVEKLAAAERKLAQDLSPIEALRAWMLLFVDYIATKQIIAPALNTLVGGPSKVYEASGAQITGAIHALVG